VQPTLEEVVGQLYQDNQRLQGRLAALEAAAAVPPPPAARGSILKPTKPPRFCGERGQEHQDVDTWLFALDQYFVAAGVEEETPRVAFAGAMLDRTALAWWQLLKKSEARGGEEAPATWAAFQAALATRFQPINAERVAREQLMSLRQSGGVAAYAARFQQLLLKVVDLPEAHLVHMFIAGLKPDVQKELRIRDPAALAEAITTAERVDSVLRPQDRAFQPRPPLPSPAPRLYGGSGPSPMELGAVQ